MGIVSPISEGIDVRLLQRRGRSYPLVGNECYSYRSASTGLIAAARRAGSHAESMTTLLTTMRAPA